MLGRNVKRPLNVAHRGGAGLAPENTLAAFQKALDVQADAIELDLHLSQDGALMVIHDAHVHSTTDGRGEVGDMTLAALKTLNAAATFKGPKVAPQPVPTLEEVLALVQGHAQVQIEIKQRANGTRYAGIEARVLEVVRHYDLLDAVTVMAFDFRVLQDIKGLEPNLRTCALIASAYLKRFGARQRPALVADDLASQGFDRVGVKHTLLTRRLLAAFRERGFQVGVWTVNTPSTMRKFVDMGVDFITSDRPDLLRNVLQD